MTIEKRKEELLELIQQKLGNMDPQQKESILLNVKSLGEASYLELERLYESIEAA